MQGALAHEFEDMRLTERAAERFAGARPTLMAASCWVLQSPVASRSMARRTLSVMRSCLSIGSAGAPALTAASARFAGVLASIVSAFRGRWFGAEHIRKIDVLSKSHGALVRLLDRGRGAGFDGAGDIGDLRTFTE
jgi:hypothetical protein